MNSVSYSIRPIVIPKPKEKGKKKRETNLVSLFFYYWYSSPTKKTPHFLVLVSWVRVVLFAPRNVILTHEVATVKYKILFFRSSRFLPFGKNGKMGNKSL